MVLPTNTIQATKAIDDIPAKIEEVSSFDMKFVLFLA